MNCYRISSLITLFTIDTGKGVYVIWNILYSRFWTVIIFIIFLAAEPFFSTIVTCIARAFFGAVYVAVYFSPSPFP